MREPRIYLKVAHQKRKLTAQGNTEMGPATKIEDEWARRSSRLQQPGFGRPSAISPDLITLHMTITEFLAEHLDTPLGPVLQQHVTM